MNRHHGIFVYIVFLFLLFSTPLCCAEDYQEADVKVNSIPTSWNITLTWSIAGDAKGIRVLVIRKKGTFPQSIEDGKVIYFGKGTSTVDENLVADTEYFYRFFLINTEDQITGWARHNEKT
jgi:hypothetical protein